VTFCQRLGFEVTDERPVTMGEGEFANWIMVYR
jgi:hypothetical protein